MISFSWNPLLLSLKLALFSTFFLIVICVPLAYYLSHKKSKFFNFIDTLFSMPLVLPPTVLGFYFLTLFGKNSFLGNFFYKNFNLQLIFSFEGIVLANILFSFPFMLNPIKSAFQSLSPSLEHASYSLGKSKARTLIKILLPNIKFSLITGAVLTFAHSLGAFGFILMIGGNIPGKTNVASVTIYNHLDSLNYSQAHHYAFVLFLFSFIIMFVVNLLKKKEG